MTYPRYIKKKGKVYGPYYYKSVRDKNGNVQNVYVGRKPESSRKLPVTLRTLRTNGKLRAIFVTAVILLILSAIPLLTIRTTGFTIYTPNQNISETLYLEVNQFVQKGASLHVQMGSQTFDSEISSLVSSPPENRTIGNETFEGYEVGTLSITVDDFVAPGEDGNYTMSAALVYAGSEIASVSKYIVVDEEEVLNETAPENITSENVTEAENVTDITIPENITEINITGPPENVTNFTIPENVTLENITEIPENVTNITVPENITETKEKFPRLFVEKVVEFSPAKREFGMNEKPRFRLISKKVFSEHGRIIEEGTGPEVLNVSVYGPDQKLFDVKTDVLKVGNGEYEIEISKERAFRPGLYRIRIVANETDSTEEQEIEFLWGVVSLNTRKSIYRPGETAEFEMVVLDSMGHSVCSADASLTVTDPDGGETSYSTADGTIRPGPECGLYEADYSTAVEGNHTIDIKALIDGVEVNFSTYFAVMSRYDFDVIRSAQSKIDPTVQDKFNVRIDIESFEAAKNITVNEFVPAEFNITDTDAEISKDGGTKTLTWSRELAENKTYVAYSYSVPHVWPYLYELGPAEIAYDDGTFTEARPWYVAVDPYNWPNSSFDRCRNITLKGGNSVLTDFPYYIKITNTTNMLPDYKDLRFYNDSCNNNGTLLAYEIENYTATNVHIWIRIPTLPTAGKNISVYYKNNTAVSSGENKTGVWDSNYVMVQHMAERSGTLYDSTNYGNNGTKSATHQNATGKIDGANYFPSGSYINVTDSSSLMPTNAITVEAWANSTGVQYGNIFSNTQYADVWLDGYILWYNSATVIRFMINSYTANFATSAITSANMNYIVGTYDKDAGSYQIKIYVNGVNGTPDTYSTAISYNAAARPTMNDAGTNSQLVGIIDEVRVSNIARSADWINMSYQTVQNQASYVSFGAEETQPDVINPLASFGTNPPDGYNSSSQSITFDLKCSDNLAVNTLQLWSNWTGSWAANQTNSTPANDTWWNVTVNGIPEGAWKWGVWCNDTSGNPDWTDTNRTLTVDLTKPSPSLGTNPVASYNDSDGSLTFDLKCSDNFAANVLQLWGNWSGSWAANQTNSTPTNDSWWNVTIPGIPEGVWNWGAYCNDSAGNSNWSAANRTFRVDLTNPIASMGTNPVDYINDSDGSITFDAKCSDNAAVNTLQLWGNWTGSWAANQTNSTPTNDSWWNVTVSDIPQGTWKWGFYCNDSSGRGAWSTSNRTLTVDLTNPTASMGTNPVDYVNDSDGSLTFDLKCSDNAAVNTLQLWGNWSGSWAANQTNSTPVNNSFWNVTVSGIPAGTYKWGVYCNDSSGRGGWSTDNRTITIDLTNPTASMGTNPVDYVNDSDGSIVFDLKCSDNVNVNTLQLWGNWSGSWAANQTNPTPTNDSWWNVTVSDIPQGTWKWGVYCNDSSGRGAWSISNRTFTVDLTSPTYQNDQDDTGGLVTEGLTANVSAYWNDNIGLGYAILRTNQTGSWANASYLAFTETPQYSNFTIDTSGYAGKTICWAIWANDTSGNLNNTMGTDSHCFYVNSLPQINSAGFNTTTINQYESVLLTVNVTDSDGVDTVIATFRYPNLVTVNVTLAHQSGNNYTTEWTSTSLAGDYNVTIIYANDSLNGWNSTTYNNLGFEVIGDAPPIATLNAPPNGNVIMDTKTIVFNCTGYDEVNLINISLYGNWSGGWHKNETNTSGYDYADYIFTKNIPDGDYVWNCYACDSLGQCSFAIANYTFRASRYPYYSYDSDNSSGSVNEGQTVKASAYWNDSYGDLDSAIFRTNKTGSWSNESYYAFTAEPQYSNFTIDTTGYAGKTICWVVWANDSAGNLNGSMPEHCFDVNDITPPYYSQDQDNSSGTVEVGKTVMVSAFWNDTIDEMSLSTAILRTNKTGSWSNESYYAFTAEPQYSNFTIDTTGYAGKTICWAIWANDTSGNLNNTMGQHCFDVKDITPPTYQYDSDNSSGSVNEGQTVKASAYWNDNIGLGYAILRTNQTGSWANASYLAFTETPQYSNFTIDTTGYAGKTICWAIWANDTSGNLNNTMGTDSHCFDVNDITPPYYSQDQDNSTGVAEAGVTVGAGAYWNDNVGLGYSIFRTNETGSWVNTSYLVFTATPQYANFTIDTTGHPNQTICWMMWANDTSGNLNNTMGQHCFDVADTVSPFWSQNSTSSELAGWQVEHRVYWQDEGQLAGYIFSFDNCTGSFVNDTWAPFTGTGNWSNVTKFTNTSLGCTIRWMVYANDTKGNWNSTGILSYLTNEDTPPLWSSNSTNSTLAGRMIEHRVKWYDMGGLSGYVFEFCNGTSDGVCGYWANTSFDRCMNITIKNASSTALTNFPAYINLSYDSDMLANYSDLRFYNASCNGGGSLLDYEIENYTSAKADIWVRIPTLAAGNTTISVYYKNNTAVSSGQNATGVWDSNYKGVWHLKENASGTGTADLYKDSTSNSNHGKDMISATGKDGKIASGQEFDNSDDYINVTNSASLGITGDITISAWIKRSGITTADTVLTKTNNVRTDYDLYIGQSSNNDRLILYSDSTTPTSVASTPTITDTTNWHYVAVTRSGTTVTFYINGTAVAGGGSMTGAFSNNPDPVRIGAWGTDVWQGYLDEVRLSNTARSAGWINQSYQMVANQATFVTPSAEASRSGVWVNDSWAPMTGQNSWTNVTKGVNSTVGTTIKWRIYANDTSNNWNVTDTFSYVTIQDLTPPYYSQDQDNSSGTVEVGKTVLVSAFWNDTINEMSLSTAILRTNKTGSWANESYYAFTAEPQYSNFTIDTSGYLNNTICWAIWANDTSGNLNDTMGQHCFDVSDLTPPYYSQDQDNSSGNVNQSAHVGVSAYWNDSLSNINTAILRTNETGSWENMSYYVFTGTPSYSNFTIDTSGQGGKTICWAIWANDSYGNLNNTMGTASHCFYVNRPPALSVVMVTPSPPKTADTLDCGSLGSDPDTGDVLQTDFTWYRDTGSGYAHWTQDDENNVATTNNVFANTSSIGDIEPSNTVKGYKFKCQATLRDNSGAYTVMNSSEVTIQNTAPNPDSAWAPSSTHDTGQDFNWTEGTDDDGDGVTSFLCIDDDASGRDSETCDVYSGSGKDSPVTDATLTYGGAPKTYYGRLRATDGLDVSSNYDFSFTLTNAQPSAPSSASLAGQTTNSTTPTIVFTKGTDSDTSPADSVVQHVSVDSSGYTDSGDTFTTYGDISQFTISTELADGTYYVRQWADDQRGATNSRSPNYQYAFTVKVQMTILSADILPDDGDPDILINPVEGSNKRVNITLHVANSSRIDACDVRIFNSSASYSNPVFRYQGIVQNCGETCECFREWDMEYWRNEGGWNVSVYVNATNGAGNFTSKNFTYNALFAIDLNTSNVIFSGIPGQTVNSTNAYPMLVNDTGNMVVNISIKGTDFTGLNNASYVVGVGNSSCNETSGGAYQQLTKNLVRIFDNLPPAGSRTLFFRAYLPVGFIQQDYQNTIELAT